MSDIESIRKCSDDARLNKYVALCKSILERSDVDGLKNLLKHIFTSEFNDSFGRICIVQAFLNNAVSLIEDKNGELSSNIDLDDVPVVMKSIITGCRDCMNADEDIDLRNIISTATVLLAAAYDGLEDFNASADIRLTCSADLFPTPEAFLQFLLPAAPHTIRSNDADYVTNAITKLDSAAQAYLSQLVAANTPQAELAPLLLKTTIALIPLSEITQQYLDAAERHEMLSQLNDSTLASVNDSMTSAQHRERALLLLCLCSHAPTRQLLLERICASSSHQTSTAFQFAVALKNVEIIPVTLAAHTKALLGEVRGSETRFIEVVMENTVRSLAKVGKDVKIEKIASLVGEPQETTKAMLISMCLQRKYEISLDEVSDTVRFDKSSESAAYNPFSRYYKNRDQEISQFLSKLKADIQQV